MRGVHNSFLNLIVCLLGSSPHARGPHITSGDPRGRDRIIPACAGSTQQAEPDGSQLQDHPRMRGVHRLFPGRCGDRWGSSPHARGPLLPAVFPPEPLRIIPACAGSTLPTRCPLYMSKDHPRMRGVHLTVEGLFSIVLGSSPHARGPR